MLEAIKSIRNKAPFYYFEEISKIPRASGNEKGIADYLCNFANERNLELYRDEANNVLIKKQGSKGRENEECLMLQAHTDMVAEKNLSTVHDFAADPIKLVVEGNILRAEGTTLGADDGFGVAIMLAILDSKEISHMPLECLFTSSEEIGLVGAGKFDYSKISSKRMINLDSAEENTVIIGCCGGVRTELTLPVNRESVKKDGYKITIGGLQGGHSGEDIDKKRLNAHKLMGKILRMFKGNTRVRVSTISGGDKDNAIPRECELSLVPDDYSECENVLSGINEKIRNELRAEEDNGLFVNVEKTEVESLISYEDTEKLLKCLLTPNGVLCYRSIEPFIPQTSRNLARIRTTENEILIGFSSRSYLDSQLEGSMRELDLLAKQVGATTYHHERYPGWASDKDSELVKKYQSAYNKATGKETKPTLIHAGLECGLISSAIGDFTAISIGANVCDLHTPKETMEIDSFDRIYDAIVEVLK